MNNPKPLLRQYAEWKKEIKKLEEKLKTIEPDIFTIVRELLTQAESGETNIKITDDDDRSLIGTFYIMHRTTWTYTDEVKLLESSLKTMKKEEEAKGIATGETKEYVAFKETK